LQRNEQKRTTFSFYGAAINLGLNMAVGVAVFTAVGYYVDQRFGGGRAFTLCGIFLGLLYGAYEVWKVVRQINEAAEEQQGRPDKTPGDDSPGN